MSLYDLLAPWYNQIIPPQPQAAELLQSLPIPPVGTVLDLGCGVGDLAAALVPLGHPVVGIDLDANMILQGRRQSSEVTFHVMNMLDMAQLQQSFALITTTGNVLSHLPPSQVNKLVPQLSSQLLKGGWWVVQTVNWDLVLQHTTWTFPERHSQDGQVTFSRCYKSITPDSVQFETELRIEPDQSHRETTTLYPIPDQHICELCTQHGLKRIHHYADFAATPFSPETSPGQISLFQKV